MTRFCILDLERIKISPRKKLKKSSLKTSKKLTDPNIYVHRYGRFGIVTYLLNRGFGVMSGWVGSGTAVQPKTPIYIGENEPPIVPCTAASMINLSNIGNRAIIFQSLYIQKNVTYLSMMTHRFTFFEILKLLRNNFAYYVLCSQRLN